ncbi:hypothetical protein C8Q75DRAFT_722268 [Abortiporus biennis]|nr:hypothetical protein C8Q75DRAFT_722268 [Abortiporus biennis]
MESTLVNSSFRSNTPDKPLPLPPSPSPYSRPVQLQIDDDEELTPHLRTQLSSSSLLDTPTPVSKRTHALMELLTSERAYCSDLRLLRDMHIPLALGLKSLMSIPPTPPSSGPSSRTPSAVSGGSNDSDQNGQAPMSEEDVKIVFNNILDIAAFSESFAEQIEKALGNVIEGGTGIDHVGQLFLHVIDKMESLYTAYITRHPISLDHLTKISDRPAMKSYIEYTNSISQHYTHAWDIPSFLIKPVQRLLKYALLLAAIIDETPDSHPDKYNLRTAKAKMEVVAHSVNEGRRRREIVRDVLNGVPAKRIGDQPKAKKKGLNLGVAASIHLGRMKTFKAALLKPQDATVADANAEAADVKIASDELREAQLYIRHLARDTVRRAETLTALMESLKTWTITFGNVIGITEEQTSDAFDAFLDNIHYRVLPICKELSEQLESTWLVELDRLLDSTNAPERLVEAMNTLEPLHYGLLNANVSKTRPPPQLLEASKSYVALRAQLAVELPKYVLLLRKGIELVVRGLYTLEAEYWFQLRERWGELWEALRVDGEMKGEASETLRVWWSRFAEVDSVVSGLNIVHPITKPEKHKERELEKHREPKDRTQRPKQRKRSMSSTVDVMTNPSLAASNAIAAIDPNHSAPTLVSSTPNGKTRVNSGDLRAEKRPSNESLRSRRSGKSSKSTKVAHSSLSDEPEEFYDAYDSLRSSPATSKYSSASTVRPSNATARQRSLPISHPMQLKKSSSLSPMVQEHSASSSTRSVLDHDGAEDESDRGRASRKPSFRRRVTETLRPSGNHNSSSHSDTSRQRRSPSLPSLHGLRITPSPSPRQASFNIGNTRGQYSRLPAMYSCKVIHVCTPPLGVSYHDLPFFTLMVGDVYDVLQESGHPATHPELPLYVDDGEDCLLLVRDEMGDVGWALASFLIPTT